MYREQLTGFTAHFASWIAQQVEQGTLQDDISQRYEQSIQGYRKKIQQQVKGNRANTGRLVSNWATLVTVYQLLSQFLKDMDDTYLLPMWQDSITETIQSVRNERASEVFLDVLGQLLASGEVILAENRQNPAEPPSGKTIVGYKDKEFIHLLPEMAFRAVNRIQPLKFTASAIGSQLREDGILLTNSAGKHLTVRIRIRGTVTRVWRLQANLWNSLED